MKMHDAGKAAVLGLTLVLAIAGCTNTREGYRRPVAHDDPPVQVHDGSLHFAMNDEMWLVPNNGSSSVVATGFVDAQQHPAVIPADWTEVDVCNAYNAASQPPCAHGIVIKPYPPGSPGYFLVSLSDNDYPDGSTNNSNKHRYTDHMIYDSAGSHDFWPNVLVVTGALEGTTSYNCSSQNSNACKVNFGPTY
jgi:hypothetical protein